MDGRCDINRCSTRFWMHISHTKTRYLQWYSNRSSVGDFRGFREHISFAIKLLNIILISLIAVFIFLPIFVHHWRWVYSQCKSRITKLRFLLNLPKYFISLNERLRFKTPYFIFAPRMHTVTSQGSAKFQLFTNLGQTLTVWGPLV
jgi:hypothetical protein